MLSHIEPDKKVVKFIDVLISRITAAYWVSDFRLHRAISAMAPLSFRTQNPWIESFRFHFYLVWKSSYKYFGLSAAILNFRLPVTTNDFINGASEFLSSENLDRASDITFLFHLEADLLELPAWRPPYWISDFRLHRTISAMAPFSFRAQNPWIEPLRSRFYLVWKPRYKYFRFTGRHLEFLTSVYI